MAIIAIIVFLSIHIPPFRHGIIPAGEKGIAPQDSFESAPHPSENAQLDNCFFHVMRTGGIISALGGYKRGNAESVCLNDNYEKGLHGFEQLAASRESSGDIPRKDKPSGTFFTRIT